MQRLIDPAGFPDTLKVLGPRVIVPLLQLFQRDLIGRISINLVGAKKNEHRVGRMLARGFEKVHCPKRIHFEIKKRNLPRFIV